eukprot:TRINITY_DN8842_c0_g1_i1.p1 TRINITY_DN8842_c0_g1~~TRINITY_DN8842_c0_g1_i1.p1  ORF type:complete len:188 (+),score=27.32 TRINITY_DN8842_c0_g1_i1:49-612(+)
MGCGASHQNVVEASASANASTTNATEEKPLLKKEPAPVKTEALEVEELETKNEILKEPVLDVVQGLELATGDVEFFLDLHQQYQSMFGDAMQSMTAALDAQPCDWKGYFHHAHSLKGAALNIGIKRFGMCCKSAEYLGRELEKKAEKGETVTAEDIHKARLCLTLLSKHWPVYVDELADYRNRASQQ